MEVVCQGQPPAHRRTRWRSCVRDSPRHTGGPGGGRVSRTAPGTQEDQVEVVCHGQPSVGTASGTQKDQSNLVSF